MSARTRRPAIAIAATIACMSIFVGDGLPAHAASTKQPAVSWNPLISDTNFLQNPICADVLYVGVRGSSEHSQLGTTMSLVEDAVKTRTTAGTGSFIVQPVYLDYPASNALYPVFGPVLYSTYLTSINTGVVALTTLLETSRSQCPGQRVVLTGYSQGALVIDEVLHNYVYSKRVIGVGILGDPGNYPGKPQILEGSRPNPVGQRVFDKKVVRYETPDFLKSVTWSVCSHGDVVCDYVAATHRLLGVATGAITHTSYAKDRQLASYYYPLAAAITAAMTPPQSPPPSSSPSTPPSSAPSSSPSVPSTYPSNTPSGQPTQVRPFQPTVNPSLLVSTAGSMSGPQLDVSATWWADFKQAYTAGIESNSDWPKDFIGKFEAAIRANGSWGVIEYPQVGGYDINFWASSDPNVTCQYANNEFRCSSQVNATAVTGVMMHKTSSGFGCGSGCSADGIMVYGTPQENVPINFLGFNQSDFYVMHANIIYPDGYSGPRIPTETQYPLLSQSPGNAQ